MEHKDLSTLSDEELLAMAKEMKSSEWMHALLIGFLIGVIVFSVVKSTLGLFTLIPLYFIYKLVGKKSEQNDALKAILKERNLD